MKTLLAGAALAGMLLATPAVAETSVGVSITIGNAPPPPVIVYREEPRWILVPERSVYVIDDDDCDYDFFRVGAHFYVFNDGYWYRARSYRGPFRAIHERYVPRSVFLVPATKYKWRHHPHGGPPGQVKKVAVVKEGHEKHGRGHR